MGESTISMATVNSKLLVITRPGNLPYHQDPSPLGGAVEVTRRVGQK